MTDVRDVLAQLDALSEGQGKVDLEALKTLSDSYKPGGVEYDDVAAKLEALAEDGPAARELITEYLGSMDLGYDKSRQQPIMTSGVLTWLIERVANLLDNAPSYRFRARTDAELLDEEDPVHEDALTVVEGMDMTSALRKLHRASVNTGQAYLRLYPTRKGIRPRVFGAARVLRIPDPSLGDDVQEDLIFGLPISGGLLEVHWISGSGARRMVWLNAETGEPDDRTPYADAQHETGRALLPVVLLASDALVGSPYASPRASRVTYTLAVSGLANDLHAMTALQAHALMVWIQGDRLDGQEETASPPPPKVGPGAGFRLPAGDELRFETPKPLIGQVLDVLVQMVKMFLLGEHVPQHEAEGMIERTGQALLVAERGLQGRSEAMRPLLVRAASEAWEIVGDLVGTQADLILQIAPQRVPATMREVLEDLAKALALDLSSRIEAMQRLHGCSRAEAIERVMQVDRDLEAYGKGSAREEANTSGGGFTENLGAGGGDEGTFDSVADAVRGRSAAEARADRRAGEAA